MNAVQSDRQQTPVFESSHTRKKIFLYCPEPCFWHGPERIKAMLPEAGFGGALKWRHPWLTQAATHRGIGRAQATVERGQFC